MKQNRFKYLKDWRPLEKAGMYRHTDPGLHHLVWEVVDNSIDEALVGCIKT